MTLSLLRLGPERDDCFAMVLKEGQPTLPAISVSVHTTVDSELQFFRRPQRRVSEVHRGSWALPNWGLSCARRRIRSRSSLVTFGLPGRGRDFHRQYQRK